MSTGGDGKDPCSCANFDQATVEHISIKWNVDFSAHRLSGSVSLRVRLLESTDRILFDTSSLDIKSISINTIPTQFKILDNAYTFFGSRLKVNIPTELIEKDAQLDVHIEYRTDENASALQWLRAEQTADQSAPYLFSQCQSIHARSLLPCMDTPSVKQTYEAEVSVPEGLTCLMSALSVNQYESVSGGRRIFHFHQPIPVPSYLLAIVVGCMEMREISQRCAVWAEPSVVEKARYEFAETEDILRAAEEIAGPYIWERYDLVILPPSFPFGGMENPCLTFVTPTLIAGDRSLVSVIAHEVSHSWSGNLVTNSSWEHFWLNEGFTTFIERKILGRLVNEQYRHFHALNGWNNNLTAAVNDQFSPTHPFTRLIQDHRNIDPDSTFSCIPYEKGSALLFFLEQQLGGSEVFEAYIRAYFKAFSGKSIDSVTWKRHLYEYFSEQHDILDKVDLDKWFSDLGMPPAQPHFDRSLALVCDNLCKKWIEADEKTLQQLTTDEFEDLTPLQKIQLMSLLWQNEPPLSTDKVQHMAQLYRLDKMGNCEILLNWIRLAIKAHWEPIIELALDFVSKQGRMKYCRPVYRDLSNWPTAKKRVRETYLKTRPYMHPITAEMIAKDLHLRHSTHSVHF